MLDWKHFGCWLISCSRFPERWKNRDRNNCDLGLDRCEENVGTIVKSNKIHFSLNLLSEFIFATDSTLWIYRSCTLHSSLTPCVHVVWFTCTVSAVRAHQNNNNDHVTRTAVLGWRHQILHHYIERSAIQSLRYWYYTAHL